MFSVCNAKEVTGWMVILFTDLNTNREYCLRKYVSEPGPYYCKVFWESSDGDPRISEFKFADNYYGADLRFNKEDARALWLALSQQGWEEKELLTTFEV